MRVAIIGSRGFKDYTTVIKAMKEFENIHGVVESVVSGGAKGADALAERYAKDNRLPITVYPAEWERYGKKAGYIRNKLIVNDCDFVVAFWDGESTGTKSSLDYARETGKPVMVINF